jgi:ABC-type sugar transport system, periplasmic component
MERKWIRKLLTIVLVLCLAVSLVACGGSAKGTETTAGTTAAAQTTAAATTAVQSSAKAADLSGEIDALLWMSSYPQVVDQIVSGFKAKYPNIKVNLQMMSGNSTSENLEPRIAAGQMPDVCSVDIGEWYYTNADKGYFQDLSDTRSWQNQLDSIKTQWTSPKGVKYGVSYGVAAMFMFYNKDLFTKAGITKVPENWDEFMATCEQLKKAGITPLSWPGGFANMFGHTFISAGIANNLYAKNQDIVQKALYSEYDYSTPEWVNIYQKNVDLVKKGYVNKGYMSTDFAQSVKLFVDGEVAMTFQGSWSCGDLLKDAKFDMFLPPWNAAGTTMVGNMAGETGFGMGKSAANTKPELAKAFFDFISFENYANFQNATGTIPIYPESACPGTKVDDRLKAAVGKLTALPLNAPLAFQMFPGSVYTAMMQLGQDVLSGSKKPEDVGTVLNPIQKEYIASKK